MSPKAETQQRNEALRRRAEKQLRTEALATPEGDPHRILHELQVHQIELEMQNEELCDARTRLEDLLGKYTDLYDFAPVGYFSLDEMGRIQEVNLTGATMLEIERSHLLRRRFSSFVTGPYQSVFNDFLDKVFGATDKQLCELAIETVAKKTIWVDLQAASPVFTADGSPLCRLALLDITAQKRATEAQLRVEALEAMNTALENEISRRKAVEKSLRESRLSQSRLLKESKRMEKEMRLLSHQILHTQEEERKRISQNLHDEIAQTLVAINVHLATLAQNTASNQKDMAGKIMATQKLVEHSVESVHRFAIGLRPTQLNDLGLIQALRSHIREFENRTKIPVILASPDKIKLLGDTPAVALFRVAQAALSNVSQHANAKHAKVEIRQTQRSVRMEISDDGKSFDVKKALYGTKVKRLGLIGMRERVEMAGGKFNITSSLGKGTKIHVTVPYAKTPSFPSPDSQTKS